MSHCFRTAFKLNSKGIINWFPGHMGKGLRQMQQKLKQVDCIIEVHDARIPFSGRNSEFKHTISGVKPHILVLNKKDLADKTTFRSISEQIKKDEGIDNVIYTNCKNQECTGIRKLIPLAKDIIMNSNRFNRTEIQDYCIMVIGVPNVGKSSILNVIRNRHLKKKKATAVGAIAGITRSVLNKIKVCENPLIYMIDTPGILEPRIRDDEMGMKLALCGCLKDDLVGEENIADYLLYLLNKQQNFSYTDLMGIDKPTDEICEVLIAGANKLNKIKKMKRIDGTMVVVPDVLYAAQYMIKYFRTGYFGPVNLDKDNFRQTQFNA